MKCPNCGIDISDDSLFCKGCGYKIVPEQEKTEETQTNTNTPDTTESSTNVSNDINTTINPPMPKKSVNWKIVVGAIAAIAVIVLICIISSRNKPINRWTSLMDSESYEGAVTYYDDVKDSMSTDDINNVRNRAIAAIDEIYTKYNNREIEYEIAINQLDKIKKIDVASNSAEEKIAAINSVNSSRSAFSSAEDLFSGKRYDEAISYYKKVVPEDSENYTAASAKIEECINLYREEALKSAKEYENTGDYASAVSVVDSALSVLNNDEQLASYRVTLETAIEDVNTQNLIDEVKSLRDGGDIEAAMTKIASYRGNDNDAIALKGQITDQYAAATVANVIDSINDSDVDSAKKTLNDATRLVADNDLINEWAGKIDDYYPVSLVDLSSFLTEDSDGNLYNHGEWIVGKDYDNMGKTDYRGIKYNVSYTKPAWESVTYIIDGKYDIITGSFSILDSSKDRNQDDCWATLSIYGDDVCLYTSPVIKGGVFPVDFSVDISNVDQLKYRIDAQGGLNFAILNPELKKLVKEQ